MDIYKVFDVPRVTMLEKDIALWNDHSRYTDEEHHVIEQMLKQRRGVLYELNAYDDVMKQLLTAFNDRLHKACIELYKRVMAIYDEYCRRTDYFGEFEVERKSSFVLNTQSIIPSRRKPPNRCGMPLLRDMNLCIRTGAPGHYVAARNILHHMVDMRLWRNGLVWMMRTTIGTKDLTGSGRKTCI